MKKKGTNYGLVGDIVEIKWRDSTLELTQCNENDSFSVSTILSIGQLIKVEEDFIVIAGDIMEKGDIRRVIIIPKENIIN